MSLTMLLVLFGLCYASFRIGQAAADHPDGVVGLAKSWWKRVGG